MNRLPCIILSVLFAIGIPRQGFCLDTKGIIILKKAGISDKTIHVIVKEKVIETCAFTINEIVDLKKAGLSDKTIRMLIEEGSFMKDMAPIVYGQDVKPIRFTTIKDIIALKDAGISDEIIQAIILSGSKHSGDRERERAWEMLKNMGIIVDHRKMTGQ